MEVNSIDDVEEAPVKSFRDESLDDVLLVPRLASACGLSCP
jgi:hypothetical protein